MRRATKGSQLQLRVSQAEKSAIRRAAQRAGMDMSAYVLSRVLPAPAAAFQAAVAALEGPAEPSFALAEINSLLSGLTPQEMKCLAMRIGAAFHDEDDVRFLLRLLDVRSYERALAIITKYYPFERFPQKALYALEDLLVHSAM